MGALGRHGSLHIALSLVFLTFVCDGLAILIVRQVRALICQPHVPVPVSWVS